MSSLFTAHNQWRSRPDDQRFESVDDMLAACKGYADTAKDVDVFHNNLRVVSQDIEGVFLPDGTTLDKELVLVGKSGNPARLTNYSFEQVCKFGAAPADYMRRLPQSLAIDCLNTGLAALPDDTKGRMTIHKNGETLVRCFTSEGYARIWNYQVIEKLLLPAVASGWQVPPARPCRAGQAGARAATAQDVLLLSQRNMPGLAVKEGDLIAPAGLYASDRDMFAFMVNEQRVIEDGSDGGLATGFFLQNGEVPGVSLKFTRFLYRAICGNHIVWGAKKVQEVRIVHKGDSDLTFGKSLADALDKYSKESQQEDLQRITAAKNHMLGDNRKDVVDLLFGLKSVGLGRKQLERSYDYAVEQGDTTNSGSPRSAWGFAQGVTRLSQLEAYGDSRTQIDLAAGKILDLAV